MNLYAYLVDGRVHELIPAIVAVDGAEVQLSERYAPEFVQSLVPCDESVEAGMAYDGATFAPYVPPAPTPEEALAVNTATRDGLLSQAALAIAPLQDAVDLDEATDEELTRLKLWKQYRVSVNRIDLTQIEVAWPVQPAN